MPNFKKISKFEATHSGAVWVITTFMDLESLTAAVTLMFDSTSTLQPNVRETNRKNTFVFHFPCVVSYQILADRINRYNAHVYEYSAADGLRKFVMPNYKKISKFEATRNPARWIITTLMDLESLNETVKLMFDSTSALWPTVRKTGLWKNKFYFDFKFGVCEQVLAVRINRYNAQVYENPADTDGLEKAKAEEKAKIDAVVQHYSRNQYLLKTKCYTQILCEDDAMCLLKWLNDANVPKTSSSRTPLLRDCDVMLKAIVAAIDGRRNDETISEVAEQIATQALTPFGFGAARTPMYQNLESLHRIVDKPSSYTDTDTIYSVHYIKTPVWSMSNEANKQTKNRISQFLIFNKGDKNPHYFPCCMGYGFELHFAKPVLFENNGKAREDTISLISKACNLCRPTWLQSKYNDLTFYEIWPEKDLLSIEILPGCDAKWPSESIAKKTRDMCLQKVIELFNGKSAYPPTEIKITKKVVPTVSIKPGIESEPKIVLKPSEVSIKSEAVLIQVSQNVKAKSLLSRIMH